MSTAEVIIQSVVALVMIGNPVDPVKILIFNKYVERTGTGRRKAALALAVLVAAILAGAALVGKELLELVGINLGAFGFVGGLLVASMGFEMLYAGRPSKAQGADDEAAAATADGADDMGLVMPLAVPLMAGPGALTTAITIVSSKPDGTGLTAGLIGAGVMGVLVFVGMAFLGGLISKASPRSAALMQRIGGLLLATIGAQLALSGIRNFYGF